MKQCKPCITIRDIAKIIWYNTRLFYTNCRKDISSYSRINQTVCVLDNTPALTTYQEYELIKKIRDKAQDNYDPMRQELAEQYINERKC